jgi:formylglycine-generating enzyme required for sulfatase activity
VRRLVSRQSILVDEKDLSTLMTELGPTQMAIADFDDACPQVVWGKTSIWYSGNVETFYVWTSNRQELEAQRGSSTIHLAGDALEAGRSVDTDQLRAVEPFVTSDWMKRGVRLALADGRKETVVIDDDPNATDAWVMTLAQALAKWLSVPCSELNQPKAPALDDVDALIPMALIPAGQFTMGLDTFDEQMAGVATSWDALAVNTDSLPLHEVRISRPFELGIHMVTEGQWKKLLGREPPRAPRGDSYPVNATWNESQIFIARLNALSGGARYRLPTEAEWEYACRAGSKANYCCGDRAYGASPNLRDYAWYSDNSGDTLHPVGEKQPNAWGLYDMHGNLWEWTADWYAPYAPKYEGVIADPQGPPRGEHRVARGGTYENDEGDCRSGMRVRFGPSFDHIGFRIVRTR